MMACNLAPAKNPKLAANDILADLERRGLLELCLEIAAETGVTCPEMVGYERTKKVVRARHLLWASIHDRGFSYPEIASLFDRDHSTVFHGVKRTRSA